MIIGLDYDDTITRDYFSWAEFIRFFISKGHCVYIVTWRFPDETDQNLEALRKIVTGIHFTGRKAKEKYMYSQGIKVDVWIDDNPSAILYTMEGFE